jgi:carbonic anhydrase
MLDLDLLSTHQEDHQEESMQKLVEGVHRFQKDIFGHQRELFERLAKHQEPDTLFITCSDSRVNPALLTQTEPGEVFILRNAGNIVPPWGFMGGEAATLEFAVAGLGVKDIIVCGHSNCGAMKALIVPPPDGEMPAMRKWLEHAETARQVVKDRYKGLTQENLVNVMIQENVLAQVENLRTHPAVAAALRRGSLRLHGWVYKLDDGQVFAFDPEAEQFRPLAEVHAAKQPVSERLRGRMGT